MPIIKSAKKRVKTAEKAAIRNSKTKRSLKTALKSFHLAVTTGTKTADSQAAAQSNIDKAAKKGLIHKNKAARQKAQLAKIAKVGSTGAPAAKSKTTSAKKAAVAKAAPKKATTVAKKSIVVKKVVAKAPAKKPVAKKTTKK
jgi:small subunit ribosomal protein S20